MVSLNMLLQSSPYKFGWNMVYSMRLATFKAVYRNVDVFDSTIVIDNFVPEITNTVMCVIN